MIINIENDLQKGPGHARITLRARSGEPLPAGGEAAPQFIIESPGRGEFLGRDQWTQAEFRLEPDTWQQEGDALVLQVGPAVVDHLEALENYRFTLLLAGGEKSGALVCKNITPSPMQGGRTGFGSFDAARPAPPITPPPAPEPEPVYTPPAQPAPPQTYAQPVFNPAPAPETLSLKPDAPPPGTPGPAVSNIEQLLQSEPGQGGGKKFLIVLGIILLLLILAGGAIYLLASSGNGTEDAAHTEEPLNPGEPDDEPVTGPAGESDTPAPAEPTTPPPPPDVAPRDPASIEALQMARGVLRDEPGDDDIRRALTLMPLDNTNADANFLLREELAERGDAESMFLLGQFYDPSQNLPTGSIEKDPEQALYWYKQAQAGGWQSSNPALDNLRAWLQVEADNGNPDAQRLLDSME